MAYINRNTNQVYLATPRTASRATATVLRDHGFERCGGHHCQLKTVIERNEVERSELDVATTIRDPSEIMLSFARRYTMKNRTYNGVINDLIENNSWIEKGNIANRFTGVADTIFRYEDDLDKQISNWIGKQVKLPEVGKAERDPFPEEGRIKARKFCKHERIELGYL